MTIACHRIAVAAAGIAALAGSTAVGTGTASAAPASPPPPPTLSGETLTTRTSSGGVTCDNTGQFSFTAAGSATGPYNGTFTESGSGFVGAGFKTTSFTATFTINSPTGTVTGTKAFSGSAGANNNSCYHDPDNFTATTDLSYQADITASTGRYSDQGSAVTFVFESNSTLNAFHESFVSSLTQPTPLNPTSKDQCKHGGYRAFPQFKNQGDCVSFVVTRGKKAPPPDGRFKRP